MFQKLASLFRKTAPAASEPPAPMSDPPSDSVAAAALNLIQVEEVSEPPRLPPGYAQLIEDPEAKQVPAKPETVGPKVQADPAEPEPAQASESVLEPARAARQRVFTGIVPPLHQDEVRKLRCVSSGGIIRTIRP
jgi:hypothetical protein